MKIDLEEIIHIFLIGIHFLEVSRLQILFENYFFKENIIFGYLFI